MRKSVKGFTLLELIISIAITAVLLVMIGMLFKPIGTMLNVMSTISTQRTSADGINEYVTGNLRYATGVQVYMNVTNLPATVNGTVIETYSMNLNVATANKLQLLAIYNDSGASGVRKDTWQTTDYTGRVYRSKTGLDESKWYEALGKAFYGRQTFQIYAKNEDASGTTTWTAPSNFYIMTTALDQNGDEELTAQNSVTYINASASGTSKFEVYDGNDATDLAKLTGTSAGDNTFIVYVLPN